MNDTQATVATRQTLTVTVEVSGGVDPAEAVAAINEAIGGYDDGTGFYVGRTDGTPAHAVAGEPFVPGTPGTEINVYRVTLQA